MKVDEDREIRKFGGNSAASLVDKISPNIPGNWKNNMKFVSIKYTFNNIK